MNKSKIYMNYQCMIPQIFVFFFILNCLFVIWHSITFCDQPSIVSQSSLGPRGNYKPSHLKLRGGLCPATFIGWDDDDQLFIFYSMPANNKRTCCCFVDWFDTKTSMSIRMHRCIVTGYDEQFTVVKYNLPLPTNYLDSLAHIR